VLFFAFEELRIGLVHRRTSQIRATPVGGGRESEARERELELTLRVLVLTMIVSDEVEHRVVERASDLQQLSRATSRETRATAIDANRLSR
jgi:hypothetical protein